MGCHLSTPERSSEEPARQVALNQISKQNVENLKTDSARGDENGNGRDASLYRNLDRERKEIRLLLVKAGSGSELLDCELQHVYLTAVPKPSYETISYHWEDPSITADLNLNGTLVQVPVSARDAIQAMRHSHQSRVLWIDALCINQNDVTERGHQVGIMHEIYRNTQTNLIWLGHDDGTTAGSLDTLYAVLRHARAASNNLENFSSLIYHDEQSEWLSIGNLGLDVQPLFDFYSKPWFGRLVVQEVALPSNNVCICGTHEILLQDILVVAAWLVHTHPLPHVKAPAQTLNLDRARNLFHMADRQYGRLGPSDARPPPSLLQMLYLSKRFETTDPKDRLYALLGIYQSCHPTEPLPKLLTPDYNKPLMEILRDAARFTTMEVKTLRILARVRWQWNSDIEGKACPSWVPHFHRGHDDVATGFELGTFFYTDDSMGCKILDLEDPNILAPAGFVVGFISAVTPALPTEAGFSAKTVSRALSNIHDLTKAPLNTNQLERSLICDRISAKVSATPEDCSDFKRLSRYLDINDKLPPSAPRKPQSSDGDEQHDLWRAARYCRAMYGAWNNRCFFTATSAYIGIGPKEMEVGDTLAVLYGCKWPVVLRQVDEYFKVVGICYVDGIMYGEAVRKHRADGNEDVVFYLS